MLEALLSKKIENLREYSKFYSRSQIALLKLTYFKFKGARSYEQYPLSLLILGLLLFGGWNTFQDMNWPDMFYGLLFRLFSFLWAGLISY